MCLGPKRSRQVISFEDRIIVHDDQSRPLLTMFEHVEGARVSKGLFPSYQLPNGKQAFMYYNGGSLLDEVRGYGGRGVWVGCLSCVGRNVTLQV